jgi:hypothetical protein
MSSQDQREDNDVVGELIRKYKKVFDNPDGEFVIKDLMTRFNVIGGTYSESPNQMYFREGERSAVRFIMDTVEMDEQRYKEIVKETTIDF